MARKLTEFVFDKDDDKRYLPWDIWLNGEIWEIPLSDTNYSTTESFVASVWQAARRRGLRIKTKQYKDERKVVIQSYKEDE